MKKALDLESIKAKLSKLKGSWILVSGEVNKISAEFKFKNFSEALAFTNKVGAIAEAKNHHPDLVLKWGYVKIELWTHDADGLTNLDFELAQEINGTPGTKKESV